jgi:hypothetical protein
MAKNALHLSALQRIAIAVKAGYLSKDQALIYIAMLHSKIKK